MCVTFTNVDMGLFNMGTPSKYLFKSYYSGLLSSQQFSTASSYDSVTLSITALTIVNPAPAPVISCSSRAPVPIASTINDVQYIVKSSTYDLTIPEFTFGASCTGTYTFDYSITAASNQAGVDIFGVLGTTFQITIVSPVIHITTDSNNYLADSPLLLTVRGTDTTSNQFAETTFNIYLLSSCMSAIATASSTLSNANYIVSFSATTFTLPIFTTNDSECTLIKYTLQLSDGGPYDSSFITFTAGSPSLMTVYSNNLEDSGVYSLSLVANVDDLYGNFNPQGYYSFNLTLINPCTIANLTPVVVPDQTYTIGSPLTSITFTEWAVSPSICVNVYQFIYSAVQSNGSALPTTITFNEVVREFSFYTSDSSKQGFYTINITGNFSNTIMQTQFTVNIVPKPFVVNQSPSFDSALVSQVVEAGSTLSYTLPSYSDPEGDSTTVSFLPGTASIFATYSNGVVKISPSASSKTATYTVSVKLTDAQGSVSTSSFTITVNALVTASSSSDQKTSSSSSTQSIPEDLTDFETEFDPITGLYVYKKKVVNKQNFTIPSVATTNLSVSLKANITAITQVGVLTVKFSEDILVPENFTEFNSSQLNLTVVPGAESNQSQLNFNWSVSSITQNKMAIKLVFENPLFVSQTGVLYQVYLLEH